MSNQIKISFPDSSVKEYKSGISSLEIAKSISNSLAKKILVASFNDVHIDLSTELTENGSIKFFTWDDGCKRKCKKFQIFCRRITKTS